MFFDFLGDNFFNLIESSDFNERVGFVLRLNIPIQGVCKGRRLKYYSGGDALSTTSRGASSTTIFVDDATSTTLIVDDATSTTP